MKQIEGGVTKAKGFYAASTEAGIKYAGRSDMAMIYSEKPCMAAGVFTSNIVKAAPVLWDKKIVDESEYTQAIVINAGIANACTGSEGYECCKETAKAASSALNIPLDAVLTASTGVIGMKIPVDKIVSGTKVLANILSDTVEAGTKAAKAIMTTDTKKKEIAVTFMISDKEVTIGGMCKGSGMIHINMCTMLAFITTDINIDKKLLEKALKEDVEDTFNMVSIDGDTSTNDTLLILANGMAGNALISEENEDYHNFKKALRIVTEYLAKRIAEDGEGATKLIEVKVVNASDKEQAVKLSRSVVTSSLVKTAVFGCDVNWGRIMCAMGYAGAEFNPEIVDLYISCEGIEPVKLVQNGMAAEYLEETAVKVLSDKVVTATIDLKMGDAKATAWGCDLTYDYVKINADYTS